MNRQCVEPPPPPAPPSSVAIHLNLLDGLGYGITGALDFVLPGKFGVFIEARAPNAGLFSYLEAGPYGPARRSGFTSNYQQWFQTGFGAALGVEKFLDPRPGLRGLYFAAGLELLYLANAMTSSGLGAAWHSGQVFNWWAVPHGRLGYRWRALKFLFALGVRAGAGVLVASTYVNSAGDTLSWGSNQKAFLDLSAIMDLGFFLQ